MKLFSKITLLAVMALGLTVPCAGNALHYMHGSNDENAAKIDIAGLLGAEQQDYLDREAKIVAGKVEAASAVVRLDSNNYRLNLDGIMLPVDKIQSLAGYTVRFHIWIKGENISAKGMHWTGAPAVKISLYDDYRNEICSGESVFKTRGTFPWHCYYVDVVMPRTISLTQEAYQEAVKPASDDEAMIHELLGSNVSANSVKPGLYLSLSNFGGGKVWFGGLSYEKISKAGVHGVNWTDKTYGTMAPNPAYDELPVIMHNGLNADNNWNFLSGNKAFASLKTIAGLRKYLEENSGDWFHMQKGIAKLPYLFITANELKLATGFEEKWIDELKNYLVSIQDEETGLWKANGVPNIAVSAAIASGCFSGKTQRRSDADQVATPWNSAGRDVVLSKAENIIDTLLSKRVPGTAAWNEFAMQPEAVRKENNPGRTDLNTTAAAVKLLALAAETLPVDNQQRINAQDAIRDAYFYALKEFVKTSPRITWSGSNDSLVNASNGIGMLEIIEASRCLEHRTNITVGKPDLNVKNVTLDRPALEVSWKNTDDATINSVRVYCVTADTDPKLITDDSLVCIISRENSNVRNQDPVITVKKLLAAARREWGINTASANAVYTESKLKKIGRFANGTGSKNVRVTTPAADAFAASENAEPSEFKFYAVGVNAYGETGEYVLLEEAQENLELDAQF